MRTLFFLKRTYVRIGVNPYITLWGVDGNGKAREGLKSVARRAERGVVLGEGIFLSPRGDISLSPASGSVEVPIVGSGANSRRHGDSGRDYRLTKPLLVPILLISNLF